MEIIIVIMSLLFIASVKSYVLNHDDEDQILDMSISDNCINDEPKQSKVVPKDREQTLAFVNGAWLCGNCSDINEINLIYNESYEVETTYYKEMELQIGFSLDNMGCIKIDTDEDAKVEIVSGECAGDEVTFKMTNTNNCDIWIYSNI